MPDTEVVSPAACRFLLELFLVRLVGRAVWGSYAAVRVDNMVCSSIALSLL